MIKSALVTVFATSMFFLVVGQTPCDSVQNLTSAQSTQLGMLKPQLDTALFYEQFDQIDSISWEAKNAYGSQGGFPETQETYDGPLINNTTWLDLTEAINLSRELISQDSIYYTELWRLAKGQSPLHAYQPHSIYLRYSAEVALGFLKIADKETDPDRRDLYTNWAVTALDSLATMQLPNGAFPFPDLRPYNDPLFGPMIQSFLNACGADSVNVLVNGWIIDDRGTGQFKFDAGVIADAYYQAYLYTNNTNYRNIALAIGDYLMDLKFNTNYNYNSFVSMGLTRAYQLSNDPAYLNRAIINIRYGVYPGQLANGRWVDGHNAKSVYHAIILKNTAVTINLIASSNPFYDSLKSMTVKALTNYVNYYNTCNYAGSYFWAMRSFVLNNGIVHQSLNDSIADIIGKHINQSALDGSYLDVATMGDYLELLATVNTPAENNQLQLKIYPNPSTTLLNIQGFTNEKYRIMLRNQHGQVIETAENTTQLDIAHLAPGLYFVTVQQGDQTINERFIKQ